MKVRLEEIGWLQNQIMDFWWKEKLKLQWIMWVIYRTILHQLC